MSVEFTYNSYTLSLRNPELGNTLTGMLGTAYRMSMTGSVRAYRKTEVRQRLLLNFTELVCKNIDEIIDFIVTSSGERVSLTDWEGNIYEGYITNNPLEIVNASRSSTQFTIEFEILEIIPQPSLPPEAMLYEDTEPMLFENLDIMEYEG